MSAAARHGEVSSCFMLPLAAPFSTAQCANGQTVLLTCTHETPQPVGRSDIEGQCRLWSSYLVERAGVV